MIFGFKLDGVCSDTGGAIRDGRSQAIAIQYVAIAEQPASRASKKNRFMDAGPEEVFNRFGDVRIGNGNRRTFDNC